MMDFYLDGIAASSKGIFVEEITPPVKPASRQTRSVVSGKDGFLLIGDPSLSHYVRYAHCFLPDPDALGAIYVWIHGRHTVRFSNDPGHTLECASISAITPDVFATGVELSIAFDCQPWRYHYPAAGDIVLSAGGTITNPGTAASAPRISVEASGDFALTINGELVEITGGSIVIDSDLRDCLSADGASLANERAVLSEFPVLSPGPNAISWTGSVSSVTITPRWRDV